MTTNLDQEQLTVLIVEDNPGDIRLVREILDETDPGQFCVVCADQLAQVAERLLETTIDVVLLDLSLPDASGLDTLKQMQLAAADLPIIVLTGNNDDGIALQAVQAGAQDYLLKHNLDSRLLARVLRYAIERKRYEVTLRNALIKEKDLNELKSRFVSMVSHEFRNPLAAIQSSSDLLSNYSDRMPEEQNTKHFNSIRTQIQHLTLLLNDMLEFNKAESVGLQFHPLPIDFRASCQVVVDEMQQLAGRREIKFIVNGLVEAVEMDTNLLRRALLNLLSNAVKYSPDGSVIEFSVTRGKEEIVLCIQDQGIGIPEEELSRLFEVFHRATNVGNIPGTGLGLAIVKQAVEAHGGTIAVDSQLTVGTTFTISIPICNDTPTQPQPI